MKGDKLFVHHYEPGLIAAGIDNVVLRKYFHIKGLATDDPDGSIELTYTPRGEVDARLTVLYAHGEPGKDAGVSITSLVSHRAKQGWLFLLDCALPVSSENEGDLIEALYASMEYMPALRGAMVLRTLNSYHVASFVPLSLSEWQRHMSLAILLRTQKGEDISDVRYIGHSLERSYGSLRLTDYRGKPTPDFVCEL